MINFSCKKRLYVKTGDSRFSDIYRVKVKRNMVMTSPKGYFKAKKGGDYDVTTLYRPSSRTVN